MENKAQDLARKPPRVARFEQLEVWQSAHQLVIQIYEITTRSTFRRDYFLIDQLRRAAVSITINIAEGFERDGTREFLNFVCIAKGSAGEARALLAIAKDLSYVNSEDYARLHSSLLRLSRQLANLAQYLRTSKIKGHKFRQP
ncbi:MAG: four helix bundle protein [Acidobacteriota bacterium]